MQNSGLGNAINPLLSMADSRVYGIPLMLLIGWRGELLADGSQINDEPQHVAQGVSTPDLLAAMDIPYEILSGSTENIEDLISKWSEQALAESRPVALLVKKGAFEPVTKPAARKTSDLISREEAIKTIISMLPKDSFVVSTTGKTSRELYELREQADQNHSHDFLVVGSMGHASQIAAGISIAEPQKMIMCLDGDGSFLMHMGSAAVSAQTTIKHVVLNNGVHDSVGGQLVAGEEVDFSNIAKASGYCWTEKVADSTSLKEALEKMLLQSESALLEVKIRPGSRDSLGRPTSKGTTMKLDFMRTIQGE